MDTIIKVFQDTDVGLLISLVVLGWIFYSRLDSKMEKMEMRLDQKISNEANRLDQKITSEANRLDQKITSEANRLDQKITSEVNRLEQRISNEGNRLDQKISTLEIRMDRFEEKLTDIDRRLCRMEGAFSSKDCCMLKDERQLKKAE
jgi:hypothetical protein